MSIPAVTIGLVLYRGEQYLGRSIPSLLNQTYAGKIQFLIRDHSPGHTAAAYLEKTFPEHFPGQIKIERGENLMHSGGHNQLIKQMTGEYYFCASYDAFYNPDHIQALIDALHQRSDCGFAAPKILWWDFANDSYTRTIDSTGIAANAWHEFHDRGAGEADTGQFEQVTVFGASAAAAIYRRSALDQIRSDDEYFDPLLHYKNDVDLSYRLQWAGQQCLFVPDAVCWHHRQLGKQSSKSKQMRTDSQFGHRVMLFKNLSPHYPRAVLWRAFVANALRIILSAFLAPKSLVKFSALRQDIKAKRSRLLRKVSPKAMADFFRTG